MRLRDRVVSRAIATLLGEQTAEAQRKVRGWTRRGPRRLSIFHQVDDAHSHLFLRPLLKLLEAIPRAEIELFVVTPGGPDVDPEPALRRSWALTDVQRLAASRPDLDFPAGAELPHASAVRRAQAILAAARRGREALTLADTVGQALWTDDQDQLAELGRRHEMVEDVVPALRRNNEVLQKRGHYQGGMIHYEGEWYWGVDRLHHLATRLRDEGVDGDLEAPIAHRVTDARPIESVELFFSFRSPYSYLALERLAPLLERAAMPLLLRPVLPMVMRGLQVPRRKRLYLVLDAAREARRWGVPFGRVVDPLGSGIENCMAAWWTVRDDPARALRLVRSLGQGIWAEGRNVARDDDLRTLVERGGGAWPEVEAARRADGAWRERIENHRLALLDLGLWGVPSMRAGEWSLWGQDRIPLLEARLVS